MSWILGFIGKSLSGRTLERLISLHDSSIVQFSGDDFYIASGGLPESCLHGYLEDASSDFWCVVGLGLSWDGNRVRPLVTSDWHHLMKAPDPPLDSLDGHFVALRRQNHRLELYTDGLGLRTVYVSKLGDGTAFSTRLDWLASLQPLSEIDYSAFGSHWLTFNQLSTGSLVTHITRVGPGGYVRIDSGEPIVRDTHWYPQLDTEYEPFEDILSSFMHPDLAEPFVLSLGLSGGLDSRLLLSERKESKNFNVHVIGSPSLADVRIARKLAKTVGVELEHVQTSVPDSDTCLSLLRRQMIQTQATSYASSVIGLNQYSHLYYQSKWMVDGGFGEIARRQYLNRLRLSQGSFLDAVKPARLLQAIRFQRADVFCRDVESVMLEGTLHEIERLQHILATREYQTPVDQFDLLSIWTRLPNFFGFEQNRLDALIPNYMPFAQPSVLRAAMRLTAFDRSKGRLFRRIIRSNQPELAKIPLVKGNTTYPFSAGPITAAAWTKIKTGNQSGRQNEERHAFLSRLREYALDMVHDQSVFSYAPYDADKVEKLVTQYYDGQRALASQVDWWLAFDIWRRIVNSSG